MPMSNPYSPSDASALQASLSGNGGAGLVGHDDTTVADRLAALHLADYTAVRAYAGAAKSIYITGYLGAAAPSGIAGLFTRDDSDTTSADNGGTIIVDVGGRRWKRVYSGPVDVQWFGARSHATDSTAAIVAALAAHDVVRVPAGTWNVTSISLAANKSLLTDGFDTVFQQIAGQAVGTHIINVTGSDVTVGDFKAVGNISSDTDEQNHALFIRGAANIRNIRVGNVYAKDIRGDGVYVGGLTTAEVNNVKIETIFIDNVLRNGISITGGQDIDVKGTVCVTSCGYCIFDVEPNANSQYCDGIRLRYAKGFHLNVYGLQTNWVGSVRVDFADLDPGFQPNCTPAYASYTALQYGAVTLGNLTSVRFGVLKTNNCDYRGINFVSNTGDHVADELVIDHLEQSNCSLVDPVYNAYNTIGSVRQLVVNGGRITLHASNKRGIENASGLRVSNFWCNGAITNFCTRPVFQNVVVDSAWDVYVVYGNGNDKYNPTFIGCAITFTGAGIGRLTNANRATIINSEITVNNFLVVSGTCNAWVQNSTINGVFYRAGLYERIYSDTLSYGGYRQWIDNFGMVRIKSGAPTSETDGFPMGKNVAVPATATSSGAPGQWAADTSNLYVYTGDGTTHSWRRVAIAAF